MSVHSHAHWTQNRLAQVVPDVNNEKWELPPRVVGERIQERAVQVVNNSSCDFQPHTVLPSIPQLCERLQVSMMGLHGGEMDGCVWARGQGGCEGYKKS